MLLRLCRIAVLALCASLFGSIVADAAMVSSQAGTVLVSKGDGFVSLATQSEVVPGTRVMVRPGGLALITYAGNCTVRVGSGLWVVQERTPCRDGVAQIDFTGRMNQEPPPEDLPPEPPPGINPTTVLVLGGLAVGGGIALAVILGQNGKDKPASP
jgi:hypothetical protein